MKHEDIIHMAREAGLENGWLGWCQECGCDGEKLARFAALVAAAERQACAKICDDYSEFRWSWWKARGDMLDQGASDGADELAQRIRSRT